MQGFVNSNISGVTVESRHNTSFQRKGAERAIKMITSLINSGMDRINKTDDPVVKYSLLTDKLCMGVDVMMAVMRDTMLEDVEVDPKLLSELDEACANLNKGLDSLMHWLQSSTYSPDSPSGRNMMVEAEKDFNSKNFEKLDEIKQL